MRDQLWLMSIMNSVDACVHLHIHLRAPCWSEPFVARQQDQGRRVYVVYECMSDEGPRRSGAYDIQN